LGVVDGHLHECPSSPNCVYSGAADLEHKIAPIIYSGDLESAQTKLKTVLLSMPRTQLIINSKNYGLIEYRSWLFRFVDDVEFNFRDDIKQIEIRAASRLGHSDLGVNRARVEDIRKLFSSLSATK